MTTGLVFILSLQPIRINIAGTKSGSCWHPGAADQPHESLHNKHLLRNSKFVDRHPNIQFLIHPLLIHHLPYFHVTIFSISTSFENFEFPGVCSPFQYVQNMFTLCSICYQVLLHLPGVLCYRRCSHFGSIMSFGKNWFGPV
jgi:hypothetical protein